MIAIVGPYERQECNHCDTPSPISYRVNGADQHGQPVEVNFCQKCIALLLEVQQDDLTIKLNNLCENYKYTKSNE